MDKSFIEVQFPVSKVSKESYKERKANLGQTLTGLGKWWGRKPLILVRATILGLLFPASNNPQKDRAIFLKILSMDADGLWQRKTKSIPIQDLIENASDNELKKYFLTKEEKVSWNIGITNEEKQIVQKTIFERMSYDQKLTFCIRPEELVDLKTTSWSEINAYLKTQANSLQELLEQLSKKKYGEIITVGDCFSGGGSIPFEAARMGLNAYGSDLNPIASLLTWAALNISGSNDKEIVNLRSFQNLVYENVDNQIKEWGIEINENNWRANSYLYCNETRCPSCNWLIPLAPSWVIGKGTRTIARLIPNRLTKEFIIEIKSKASIEEMNIAEKQKTITNSSLLCPICNTLSPIASIRKDRKGPDGNMISGLRKWDKDDFIAKKSDVFQERLYCIRYDEIVVDHGREEVIKHYISPTQEDQKRENNSIEILEKNFSEWSRSGYIPSDKIENGYNTDQPIRERGWQYWHQLFNPRQLLTNGLLLKNVLETAKSHNELVVGLLGVNKCSDWNSKLSVWSSVAGVETTMNTYLNQALNTNFNYGTKAFSNYKRLWQFAINNTPINTSKVVEVRDARTINKTIGLWITDPPYSDAVNYHELSEFFLAWDKGVMKRIFPKWYTNSRRVDAVKGNDQAFTKAMVEVYQNLTLHMTTDGMQVVMFTHQDPAVWAELSLILWSAGLQVTAAWNIATETESGGLKSGNYVKGTVLLILRKNNSNESGWLDDIYPQIKNEVKEQIDSMQNIDDRDDPDFTDNDYLLAAYAASLKVLTKYKKIGDIDIEYEITRKRDKNVKGPIQEIIESAIRIAYDYLIPKGLSKSFWKDLTKEEKFYIKGFDFERGGVFALSVYQELARGLGVNDYTDLLASTKANTARVKTPLELTNKLFNNIESFSKSLVRQILMAIYLSIKDEDAKSGKNWFRNELPDYWGNRMKIVEILKLIQGMQTVSNTDHWQESAQYAGYLQSLVENDSL